MYARNVAFMSAYSFDKFVKKLQRNIDKNQMKRKHYKKARFRKAASREEKYSVEWDDE